MNSNRLYISAIAILLAITSCKKDLTGNAISIEANSNVIIADYFRFYDNCDPGPGMIPSGSFDTLNGNGNGYYTYQLESGYSSNCFMITGTIPANNNASGKTTVAIDVYYTHEGNVVGFYNIELQRPHDAYAIRYEFRPDTYLE